MPDFVMILSLLYCWLFDDSALVLGRGSKKDKIYSVKLGSWEVKLFCKIKCFTTFMTVIDISQMVFMTWIYWKFKIWNILKKKNYWKSAENDVKVGVGKIKIKTWFVHFSNARSILELMLCNQNLAKLVHPTLLGSDCRAWALKLREHLKNKHNFPSK